MKMLFPVLILILLVGCTPSSEQLTATAALSKAQTQTAAPTLTATPTLTSTPTPKPTATRQPTKTPTPTPAVISDTIQYNDLEITLLQAASHPHISPNGWGFYYTKSDRTYLEIMLLARNTGSQAVEALLGQMFIVEPNGDRWAPDFYGFRTVEIGRQVNPEAGVKLQMTYTTNVTISLEKDTYLRLVFNVAKGEKFHFRILESPIFIVTSE